MVKTYNPPPLDPHVTASDQPNGSVALEVRSLSKSFGAVRAAREVSFEIRRGEVLGLLGDNGAGKTTVVNCVSGGLTPDSGDILIDGSVVSIENPEAAHRLGVETVHQDLSLVDTLDVATNLFLNREHTFRWGLFGWLGWLDRRRMYRESREILDRLSIDIPSVRQPVDKLSGGQRQAVAVGRAVAWGNHIVVLDEPTAALGVEQTRLVLDLIERLKKQGVAVLLVSHNMHDVVKVCDRVVVLRHGLKVGEIESMEGITPRHLVDMITGVALGDLDTARHTET
ncbi:MAG: ATP-binding cassette domain-containing protein [bacterium]|nr:ATP-binding cassette domain-containing protein [bacterium]